MQHEIPKPTIPPRVRPGARIHAADAPVGDILLTRNGIELVMRPIAPDDAPALVRAFAHLTPEQVRMRLFSNLSSLPLEMAVQLCDVNPARVSAFVVTKPGNSEILAEARLIADRSAALGDRCWISSSVWVSNAIRTLTTTELSAPALRFEPAHA